MYGGVERGEAYHPTIASRMAGLAAPDITIHIILNSSQQTGKCLGTSE